MCKSISKLDWDIRITGTFYFFRHPNIISYKESFFEDKTSTLCIVMEHADGGDLLQKINVLKSARKKLDESAAWSYYIQMLRGL